MFKTAIATLAAAAAVAAPSAALAGPYVNVEANSGLDWFGLHWYDDRRSSGLMKHRWCCCLVCSRWCQLGVSPDGGETDTVPSGKAGIGAPITEALGAYGEVSFIETW